MPTNRRNRRSSSRRGSRPVAWQQTIASHSLTAAASIRVTDMSHSMISAGTEPIGTCRRILISANLEPGNSSAIATYNFFTGIAVVAAEGISSGEVPKPATAVQQDWYFWTGWEGQMLDTGQQNFSFHADIRSARRLREGYRLVLVTENNAQELISDIHYRIRTLWTLP